MNFFHFYLKKNNKKNRKTKLPSFSFKIATNKSEFLFTFDLSNNLIEFWRREKEKKKQELKLPSFEKVKHRHEHSLLHKMLRIF